MPEPVAKVFAKGDRVRFACPGHHRHGDTAEVLMLGRDDRAFFVAIGFDLADSMLMWWCDPRYLELIDGGRDADSYKLNPGGMRA